MGRGSSKVGGGGTSGAALPNYNFPEAFAPGKDFQASGDVDHRNRTTSSSLDRQWKQFAAPYQTGVTSMDKNALNKDYDGVDANGNDILYGYVRTTNPLKINQQLYDSKNDGKSMDEIFTRKDYNGDLRDLQTVNTLDRVISGHVTQADGTYTRFSSPGAIQSTFGLSNAQMAMLQDAPNMTPSQLSDLNAALSGTMSYSKAYTSTSANRSMNAFSNPSAKQSKGFIFERKIGVPAGTNAYAPSNNAQESEVIFGRNMSTVVNSIGVSSDGHIVIYESYNGYK